MAGPRCTMPTMSEMPTAHARFAEIEGHRPYLVRYARAQLRDAQAVEEVVQEALLAALEALGSFQGQSTLRTWLTSILRFKSRGSPAARGAGACALRGCGRRGG